MNFWFLFWLLISAALLGFMGWTIYMLQSQKKAWKKFAAKHKLNYKSGAFMQSPEIEGYLKGYKISFFTSEHVAPDMRGSRKLTAIEVRLHEKMPMDGAVASGGMVPFIKAIGFTREVNVEHENWNKSYLAASEEHYKLKAYLTPERLKILTQLMRFPHGWICFVFRNDIALLRMDTPQSMDGPEQLEKIASALLKTAAVLEIKEGEAAFLDEKARELELAEKNANIDKSAQKAVKLELE